MAAIQKKQLANRLIISMRQSSGKETSSLKSKIRETEKRLEEISMRLKTLYEDKCTGSIPENIFKGLMNDFSNEQATLEDKLLTYKEELNSFQETTDDINDWLDLISQYTDLETLNREIVFGLIDSITVSERKKQYERQVQEITIEYRFIKNLLQNETEDIAV